MGNCQRITRTHRSICIRVSTSTWSVSTDEKRKRGSDQPIVAMKVDHGTNPVPLLCTLWAGSTVSQCGGVASIRKVEEGFKCRQLMGFSSIPYADKSHHWKRQKVWKTVLHYQWTTVDWGEDLFCCKSICGIVLLCQWKNSSLRGNNGGIETASVSKE